MGEYGNSFDFGDFFLFLVNLVVWTHKYIMQYSSARKKYGMTVFICFPLILILTASLSIFKFVFEAELRKSCLVLVRKVLSFPKYANGGGGEAEVCCGVLVAWQRFQIAIFQIKSIKTE